MNTHSSKAEAAHLEPESPISKKTLSSSEHQAFDFQQQHLQLQQQQLQQEMANDNPRAGPISQIQKSTTKQPQAQEKVL